MKSMDKKISISIRKYKNSEVIQLRRLPIKVYGDKKVSTGEEPSELNLQKYILGGLKEYENFVSEKHDFLTFREFAKDALEIINSDVGYSTKKDRESMLLKHVYPTFGDMQIVEIKSKEIEVWQSRLKPVKGADYTRRCKYLFKRLLSKAVVHGNIPSNPAEGTEPVRGESKTEREIYSREEIKLMLSSSDGWLRVFLLVRVYLGLRSAEMVGLKWNDFDFKQKKVRIVRGIRFGEFTPPKGKERIVDIPKTALDALLELKKDSKSDWVFVTKKNQYFSDCSYVNRRHFQPLLKKAGIRYKGFYSLRHSFATYALAGGHTLAYVSHMLGHKKPSTTTDYYIKFVTNLEGADKTDEILNF